MFPMPFGATVDRLRRRMVKDKYSQELTLADWSNPDTETLVGVAIAPGSSTEARTDNRLLVRTGMSLYAAPGVDVLPGDRIRAGAEIWNVTGEVANWTNPFTGWQPGSEFRIEKVEG